MNNLLILGGSGVLGSAVVNELRKTTANFLIGSRQPIKAAAYGPVNQAADGPWRPVDLLTGEGLGEALAGIDTVLHLASAQGNLKGEAKDVVMMRQLLKALKPSKVTHLVYSSIVGVDRVPYRYYQAKLKSETLIQQSPVPYTILRATQLHELVDFALSKLLRFPIGLVPETGLIQPISAQAVAQELLRLTVGQAGQTLKNLGGPQIYTGRTLARLWQQHQQVRKPTLPIPALGATLKSIADGGLTCPAFASPSQTWEAYLTAKYGEGHRWAKG